LAIPRQIANLIEDWFTDGAADGFNIMPPLLSAQLEIFSAEVIPILLQGRELFRTEYKGTMLREHYGLPWPASVFDDPTLDARAARSCCGSLTCSRSPKAKPSFYAGSDEQVPEWPSGGTVGEDSCIEMALVDP
jgi:hypothetical protein